MFLKKLLLVCVLGFFAMLAVAEEATEKVNINTADAEELEVMLNGVGVIKAKAIVKFREENGPFESLADLIKVKGIGEKTVEKNKDIIIVSDESIESDSELLELECEAETDSESAEKSSDKSAETDKTDKVADTQSTENTEQGEKQASKKSTCKKVESIESSDDTAKTTESSKSPKAGEDSAQKDESKADKK